MPVLSTLRTCALCASIVWAASVADAQTPTPAAASSSARASAAAAAAHALFEQYWEWTARTFPESATFRGDHRYGDRLTDHSPQAEAARFAYYRQLNAQIQALPVQDMDRQDRISVELLRRRIQEELEFEKFVGLRSMTVNASPFPFQSAFLGLQRDAPMATEAQARQMLARMAAYPLRVSQEIAKLRRGMEARWVPPKPVLQVVLSQLDAQLAKRSALSDYYEPFMRLGSGIAPATQDALRAQGAAAVDTHVLAAIQQLRQFIAGEYMAQAPDAGGLATYPQGIEAYAMLVRVHTTTALTPGEIHTLGMEQVARLKSEMDAVRREVGFAGDMSEFVRHLNTDRRFFHSSREDLLAGYRDIIKRIEPELPRLFAVLPRAPVGVRALPDFMGPGAAENYSPPSADGTRPGWFNANAVGFALRPKWGMEALSLHEAVPGHHLQRARAAEMGSLPAFRRIANYTAYGEGWALYAETLGPELGLYKDPYTRFGFLQQQAWRAARLVIDTGLHSRGWTRQQGIDYLRDAAHLSEEQVTSEVDRYISWPGQALSYMVGQRKILELRARAEHALGARFDIRRFHMVLIDDGQLPLDVLERLVDTWIAQELAKS